MARMGRPGMSDEMRLRLWQLWAAGRSFSEISRAVGHPPGSIFTIVKQTGGYVPPVRTRRPGFLSVAEREEISRGLARGDSLRQVARLLGRAPSTVIREIARNKGRRRYRGLDADDRAWRRARRPKTCLLAREPVLREYVAARLAEDWSPGQIAGVLRKSEPAGTGPCVSHETTLLCLSSGHVGGECAVELAGDVALEAPADFAGAHAFGGAPGDVGAGLGAAAHAGQGDGVQGPVQRPVAGAVEPVPDGAAAAGGQRAGAGERRERCVVAAPAGVGEADYGLCGADRSDTGAFGEAGDEFVDDGLQLGPVVLQLAVGSPAAATARARPGP